MPLKKYRKCFGCRFWREEEWDNLTETQCKHGCVESKPHCYQRGGFPNFQPLIDEEITVDRIALRLKGEIELVD